MQIAKKTEEELQLVNDELVSLKQEFMQAHQNSEDLSKQCFMMEQKNQELQSELKMVRSQVVDNLESERNKLDDETVKLQMTIKVKDEQIFS